MLSEVVEPVGEVAEGAVAKGLKKDVIGSAGDRDGLGEVLFGEEADLSTPSPDAGGRVNESGGGFDPNIPLLDWKNEPIPVASVAAPFLATSTPASRAEPIGGAYSVAAGVVGVAEPP